MTAREIVMAAAGTASNAGTVWQQRFLRWDAANYQTYNDLLLMACGAADSASPPGYTGYVFSSADGAQNIANPYRTTAFSVNDVSFNGSLYVAVGFPGYIATSPDGNTWTIRLSNFSTTPPTEQTISVVTWTGAVWVAINGIDGVVLRSSDGISWSNATVASTIGITSLAFGNGLVVGVGSSGMVVTSPDGVTWTARTSGTAQYLRKVVWTGTLFVACGNTGTIITSPDGITWTVRSSGVTALLTTIIWSGSLIAVGGGTSIVTSPDGVTWTSRTSNIPGGNLSVIAGVRTSTRWAMLTQAGATSSSDGLTWSFSTGWPGASTDALNAGAANNNFFVVSGSGSNYYTSANSGQSWTARTFPFSNTINSIVRTSSLFVAVGDSGQIATSPDGVTWTSRTSGTGLNLFYVNASSSLIVAVGQNGILLTSSDGITWTSRTSGTTNNLYGVSWKGSTIVVVGDGGVIRTSTDGVSWITRTSGTTNSLYAVTSNSSKYVAVGLNGTVLTSADGTTWSSGSAASFTQPLSSVVWTGYLFVASTFGTRGVFVFTSPDGITWTPRTSGSPVGFDSTLFSWSNGLVLVRRGTFSLPASLAFSPPYPNINP